MLTEKKPGFSLYFEDYETEMSEMYYVNNNSKYTNEQKQHLLSIIDSILKTKGKIDEINRNKNMSYEEKENSLQEYGEILDMLDNEYKKRQEEYEGIESTKKRG